jgi:hypothetical protein
MRLCLITNHYGIPLKNVRQPIDNESRYQGTKYIITSVNKVVEFKHLNNPSIKRH